MDDNQRRYTLEEAKAEMTRRRCEANEHAPEQAIRTLADPVGFYVCECGRIRWSPTHSGE